MARKSYTNNDNIQVYSNTDNSDFTNCKVHLNSNKSFSGNKCTDTEIHLYDYTPYMGGCIFTRCTFVFHGETSVLQTPNGTFVECDFVQNGSDETSKTFYKNEGYVVLSGNDIGLQKINGYRFSCLTFHVDVMTNIQLILSYRTSGCTNLVLDGLYFQGNKQDYPESFFDQFKSIDLLLYGGYDRNGFTYIEPSVLDMCRTLKQNGVAKQFKIQSYSSYTVMPESDLDIDEFLLRSEEKELLPNVTMSGSYIKYLLHDTTQTIHTSNREDYNKVFTLKNKQDKWYDLPFTCFISNGANINDKLSMVSEVDEDDKVYVRLPSLYSQIGSEPTPFSFAVNEPLLTQKGTINIKLAPQSVLTAEIIDESFERSVISFENFSNDIVFKSFESFVGDSIVSMYLDNMAQLDLIGRLVIITDSFLFDLDGTIDIANPISSEFTGQMVVVWYDVSTEIVGQIVINQFEYMLDGQVEIAVPIEHTLVGSSGIAVPAPIHEMDGDVRVSGLVKFIEGTVEVQPTITAEIVGSFDINMEEFILDGDVTIVLPLFTELAGSITVLCVRAEIIGAITIEEEVWG